jgi:hypothetical protein
MHSRLSFQKSPRIEAESVDHSTRCFALTCSGRGSFEVENLFRPHFNAGGDA